jgi:hypothetical protein
MSPLEDVQDGFGKRLNGWLEIGQKSAEGYDVFLTTTVDNILGKFLLLDNIIL